MAKFYNEKEHEIYWSDCDLYAPIEDAYFELEDYLAFKRLNGHDAKDQWYMLVYQKLKELKEVLDTDPARIDLLDGYKPLFA